MVSISLSLDRHFFDLHAFRGRLRNPATAYPFAIRFMTHCPVLNRRVSRALAILVFVAGASSTAWAASPFAGFAGNWKGGGTIQTDAGQEAIRCKARYATPGDNQLTINVNCASDSYRVNIVSNVVAQGNTFSGSWQETTRQLSGDVSGQIPEPNTYQASLQTVGGGLQLGARSNGKRQAITITSQGTEIRGASITLKRR